MQKTAFVLRHVGFEDLGTLEEVLKTKHYTIQYFEVGYDDLNIKPESCDLLVILGGPIGVFETDNYPFIPKELEIIKARTLLNLPTLGICLGAQMIAHVCGGRVYSADKKEIGWSPLTLSYGNSEPYFKHLENTAVLHWHRDTFTKPDDAKFKIHASTPLCKHQAFTYGNNVLGLQFHCEVDARAMEKWLIGHAHEISCLKDATVQSLRAQAQKYGEQTKTRSKLFFTEWLAQLS